MKTAVSIPDDVFEDAERLARRTKRSRSDIYSHALAEYVARHTPDEVTEAMNRALAEVDREVDTFAAAAGRRTLKRTEW
jgi:predicted transcriptional regulator